MDWQLRILETLRASRTDYDEQPDWRSVLGLYEGLGASEASELDRALVAMIDEDYKNPHSALAEDEAPFEQLLTALPAGMRPEDLLCIETAVLVAAERAIGEAFFRFNRLMRAPRWHAIYPRLLWLSREAVTAQRKLAETRAGRGLGALLGLALGDALGATVEFMSREEIRRRYPEGHRELVGGGPFGFGPGEWTDDTAMALAVARGIIESPEEPVEAVGRHFMAWFDGGPPDVGNTVRLALSTFRATNSWAAASERVKSELGSRAGGNGALMRTLPTAIAYGRETKQALAIAHMTHPHPESDRCVAGYHRMVDRLLNGATKEEAAGEYLHLRGRPEAEVRSSGYVVDTLEAAVWAFLTTETFEDCLVRAANLGDDADTVAAVAGGLAGSYYGTWSAPRRWTMALQGREQLEEAALGLYLISNALSSEASS